MDNLRTTAIDSGRDSLQNLADNFIKDKDMRDNTHSIIRETAQSLHNLGKSRLKDQSLNDLHKPTSDEGLG